MRMEAMYIFHSRLHKLWMIVGPEKLGDDGGLCQVPVLLQCRLGSYPPLSCFEKAIEFLIGDCVVCAKNASAIRLESQLQTAGSSKSCVQLGRGVTKARMEIACRIAFAIR